MDRPKRLLSRGLLFVALVIGVGWPAPGLRGRLSELACRALEPVLATLELGHGARVALLPDRVSAVRGDGEHVSSDAMLVLYSTRAPGQLGFGLSLRRELYMPLVVFGAAVLVAPVSRARRAIALTLGAPLCFVLGTLFLGLTVGWLLAHQTSFPYPVSIGEVRLLDGAVSALLMPTAPRFVLPLALALALLWSSPKTPARAGTPAALSPCPVESV